MATERDSWYPRRWPHGVIHGGTLLDMTDTLRNHPDRTGTDQAFSLWVEGTYLTPFLTVERLHGLIIRNEEDMEALDHAYERHARFHILPDGAPPAGLYVPGLEPLRAPRGNQTEVPQIPEVILSGGAKGADHYKHGIDRGGKLVAILDDERGWEREIWQHPMSKNTTPKIKIEEDDDMWVDVSKPCQASGCCEHHDEQDVNKSSNDDIGLKRSNSVDDQGEGSEDNNHVSRPGLTLNVRDVLLALKEKIARQLEEPTDDESTASVSDV